MDPRQRKRTSVGIAGPMAARLSGEKPKHVKHTLKRLWDFFKVEKKELLITFILIFISGDFVKVKVTGAMECDLIGEIADEFTK